jgi:hypothetical protein
LLGTSALTLVTLSSVTAAPVIETGDFGDTFATRTILAGQGPVYGTLGGADMFDYFQLSGFGAGQSIRIVLTQIAQPPAPSAEASASGSTDASGSEEPTSSTDASGEPTDVGFTLHLLDESGRSILWLATADRMLPQAPARSRTGRYSETAPLPSTWTPQRCRPAI